MCTNQPEPPDPFRRRFLSSFPTSITAEVSICLNSKVIDWLHIPYRRRFEAITPPPVRFLPTGRQDNEPPFLSMWHLAGDAHLRLPTLLVGTHQSSQRKFMVLQSPPFLPLLLSNGRGLGHSSDVIYACTSYGSELAVFTKTFPLFEKCLHGFRDV
jgi:hypothetical protein